MRPVPLSSDTVGNNDGDNIQIRDRQAAARRGHGHGGVQLCQGYKYRVPERHIYEAKMILDSQGKRWFESVQEMALTLLYF